MQQLRLGRRHFDELGHERRKQFSHGGQRVGIEGGNDLRQRAKLLQAVPLGDSLGTEGHSHALAHLLEPGLQPLRRSREDGAAQHENLAVPKLLTALLQGSPDVRQGRIEMLVDGRTYDAYQPPATVQRTGSRLDAQPAALQSLPQQLVGASLKEGHFAAADQFHLGGIRIKHERLEAAIGEHQG